MKMEKDSTLLNVQEKENTSKLPPSIRYDILVEQNEVGIFSLLNDRITYANPAFIKILEANGEQIIDTSILKNMIAADQILLVSVFEQMRRGEITSFSKDLTFRENSNRTKYFSIHLKVLSLTPEGLEIIGASRDATFRVQKRQELARTNAKYEALYRNTIDGIIIYDYLNDLIIDCNAAALKILCYSDKFELSAKDRFQIIPKNSHFFPSIDLHQETEGHKERVIKGDAFYTPGVFSTQKGEHILAKVNVVPTYSQEGEAYIIFHDITNEVLNKKALRTSGEKLNEKNKKLKKYIDSNLQLENFAYFASHDLQTPLRSIISFTQLLQRRLGERLSEEEGEYMDFVIQAGKNMKALINDLLLFSRVNASQLNRQRISPQQLLEELKMELSAVISEKEATLKIHSLPTFIEADLTKIRQILQNLITNALKFTRPGSLPQVDIFGEELKNCWQFSIQDNGIGIASEFQEKVFLLFKRLHGNTEYEGTGIGLSMVKKIVEQHQGKIWMDSTEGEGTTFHFTIAKPLES